MEFRKRLFDIVEIIKQHTNIEMHECKIGPLCPKREIEAVQQHLQYELSPEFLEYFRQCNGWKITWQANGKEMQGINIPSLEEMFLSGGYEVNDSDYQHQIKILGGGSSGELRSCLSRFDYFHIERSEGYYDVAVVGHHTYSDPVVLFMSDYEACITDYCPMSATTYFEMSLAMCFITNVVFDIAVKGFDADHPIIRLEESDYKLFAPAQKYLDSYVDDSALIKKTIDSLSKK